MRFRVTPAVLIPRPETRDAGRGNSFPPRAGRPDSGCGSRQRLHRHRPGEAASAGAGYGAGAFARGGCGGSGQHLAALTPGRVRLIEGGFPEAAGGLGPLDALVSNPPYIPTEEVKDLAPELRLHEPRLALDGGRTGCGSSGRSSRMWRGSWFPAACWRWSWLWDRRRG